jgi:hypothetical protein
MPQSVLQRGPARVGQLASLAGQSLAANRLAYNSERMLAVVLALAVALAIPAPAAAAKRCEGIGDVIWRLRAKGPSCDDARTLAAKWAETAATGGGRVVRIDGFRCVRSNPPGRGRAVRCAKRNGAVVVSFRYRLP